jgi:checkpoint serine/threonine-protein kinase
MKSTQIHWNNPDCESCLTRNILSIWNVRFSYSEADNMYRLGINRNPRALARLKSRYEDFQKRVPSSAVEPSKKAPSKTNIPVPPLDNVPQSRQKSIYSHNSSPSSRYAIMLAPPVPGKRSEKLRFNLSLLFTEEGKEYSVQEARARSMGLLGKKWGPPPASELNHGMAPSTLVQVRVDDDHHKANRNTTMRSRGLLTGEPTVTINTKAALADVFGMFNSPEKTVRSAQIPGSKHAPLKKLELPAPVVRPPQVQSNNENENQVAKTPSECLCYIHLADILLPGL